VILCRYISIVVFEMCFPDEYGDAVSKRGGWSRPAEVHPAGVDGVLAAGAAILLNRDFFSMCMAVLLVEGVSPTALTY
jgi:hypothetical protein